MLGSDRSLVHRGAAATAVDTQEHASQDISKDTLRNTRDPGSAL